MARWQNESPLSFSLLSSLARYDPSPYSRTMVQLTKEQQSILKTCEPPTTNNKKKKKRRPKIVRITASAGSGKTTTLLQLAAHAVTKCHHEQINYATFTTAAAKDGKERMIQALLAKQRNGQQPAPRIRARTLHSFAYRLLEDHRNRSNSQSNNNNTFSSQPPRMWSDKKLQKWIATECRDDMDAFLAPCYNELQKRYWRNNTTSTENAQERSLQSQKERAYQQVLFFIYKSLVLFTQSSMDIDTFEQNKSAFGRDYYPAKLFHKDQTKSDQYGFVPHHYNRPNKISFYSDQAAKCWRIIEQEDDIRTFDLDMKRVQLLKLKVPGTILLVDESQDMDACQIDFIVHQQAQLHNLDVYVVGDPAQAIYGFRGAKPKFLLQLDCQEKKQLTQTFRFGPAFCRIANLVLYAKHYSDQTHYSKFGNNQQPQQQPINWDPYRIVSGVPDKQGVVTTNKSILEDWKSGQVTLIARTNTKLLIDVLPLFGFSFEETNDGDGDGISNERQDTADTTSSASTPSVSQDDKSNCHLLSYDIECEYLGPHTSNIEAPILCACLKCSCGYQMAISRVPLSGSRVEHTVADCNAKIAETVLKAIISHAPEFTVGHNVYEFDNVRLACALPEGCIFNINLSGRRDKTLYCSG